MGGRSFADRSYNDDATLVDRSIPGAIISDQKSPERALPKWLKAVRSLPNLVKR